ncbi:EAL domain-containing protein [Evansella sp. LMS18]|uniref:sensor domain-containing protein n=1 Tax=Evansella sp. LMS18 TaxID=2924033 RepID=UPI0020D17A75|nr:EAL domain-containing protein [Evansella sp. LMS18]UTR11205.1 EAL domain-containing protein [Evansella sp. LMS18]
MEKEHKAFMLAGQKGYRINDSNDGLINLFHSWNDLHTEETKAGLPGLLGNLINALEKTAYVVIADEKGGMVYVSESFCDILKYRKEELEGKYYTELRDRLMTGGDREKLKEVFLSGTGYETETMPVSRDGNPFIMKMSILPLIKTEEGITKFSLILHQDITRLTQAEKAIKQLASTDNLTGLPNRVKFEQDVAGFMEGEKGLQNSFAVLLIDLDRLGYYCEILGQHTGDKLTRNIANALVGLNHKGIQIYRYGANEFSVLMKEPESASEVEMVAKEILQLFNSPFTADGDELMLSASIGITVYPDQGNTQEAVINHAEDAMQHAKEAGQANMQWFRPSIRTKQKEKLIMERKLRAAVENKAFQLKYQPQIDLKNMAVIGAEALIRWEDKELGSVSPDIFIPLAEETGLINPIGDWVLEEACRQAKKWSDEGYSLRIGINISPLQFQKRGFVEKVNEVLQDSGLEPCKLDLEITENHLLRNREESLRTLVKLKNIGIRISIDDFGTGYSSLSYLQRFPVDSLKIDRTFIKDIINNSKDQAIVTSIIQLAHNMNLRVIAEGVETSDMLTFLNARNCNEMQGFLYSKPLAPSELTQYIKIIPPAEILTGS